MLKGKMNEMIKELINSSDIINDPLELQNRLSQEGYLFFKQLQDRNKLLELRKEIMTIIKNIGWLSQSTDPLNGIADISAQCTEGDNEYTDGYKEIYKLESFHRSAHWNEVTDLIQKILGKPIMPQPQTVIRIWFPQYTVHTTPSHQDFVHFQGSYKNLSCWTPIGDCPIELGGLAVIPGSHNVKKVLDHHFSLGAGELGIDQKKDLIGMNQDWYSTNYEIGDTLIFTALTLHKALPNYTNNKLRLSMDNRYQTVGSPIAEHMLNPHEVSGLKWEDIYPTWKNEDLKYYWKNYNNPVVPQDMSYRDKGFDEALNLAKSGDNNAITLLKRITRSASAYDDYKVIEARNVLKETGLPI